ncbi:MULTISPECIES: hypothetical protein [Oxalobacteraceae]|jgi:hypothetical protein|uniref:hypothetical protein n=1 Tax=Oxalobacteraceae TaxID=75682 RepID=UPI0010A51D9E|nr:MULTISPECIES: hypothetical protein [Oxalobacteraceae]
MLKTLLAAFLAAGASAAFAQAPVPLDDAELSQVSGADGVGFAIHLSLNDPTVPDPVTDSRISMGFTVDGQTNYMVIKNLRGIVDMGTVTISVHKRTDGGGDYVALGLPGSVKYTNFGYESLSVQTNPLAPVTDSLGRTNLNGSLSMTGELRFWAN